MTSKYFSGVLIILLSLVFNTPLEAGDVGSDAKLAAQSAAGVALYAAAAVVVVLVVIHYSKSERLRDVSVRERTGPPSPTKATGTSTCCPATRRALRRVID
jgi:hypothetical protein